MMNLLSNLICTALLSTTSVDPAAAPKALSFDASAYVTVNNQIRLAVEKTSAEPVVVLLRDKNSRVLFQQFVGKKAQKYAVKLDVADLANGTYELEVKSKEGSIRKEVNLNSKPTEAPTRLVVMN
ncbi:hypothetical protein [Larkinella arboricola]|uniref:Secreted protein (Por secretion system target) n=1 Tax=Larkinella arboricola TaxID=643671 RepID=A0A327X741_LARAB|nr:hypothetical protein [Larkinella arboricola]RAK02028.1 hypothetical protein LX87_00142 [Larkinella arboricola]